MSGSVSPAHDDPSSLTMLRQQMAGSFSLDEIRTLCFDLTINFDELPHPGLTAKIRDLIDVMGQNGRLPELHAAVCRARPHMQWPDLAKSVAAAGQGSAVGHEGGQEGSVLTYLSSLIDELGLWRGLGLRRDVHLDEIYVSPLMESGRTAQEKALAESELLQQLIADQSGRRRVLIEGPAGSGKSTLLRHWALKLAGVNMQAEAPRKFLPVFLPLRYVELVCSAANEWTLSIVKLVEKRHPNLSSHSLSKAIESGCAVILLDAADEVSTQRHHEIKVWIDGVASAVGENLVVITSRPVQLSGSFTGFRRYDIRSFSREQQRSFIKRWFDSIRLAGQAALMLRYLEREDMFIVRDHSIAGNPLFLTMMCIEFELTQKLSRSPGELVDQFCKILLEDWDLERGVRRLEERRLDLKRRILESAADRFFAADRVTFSLGELLSCARIVLDDSEETIEPEALVREIEGSSGLIMENRSGSWQFSHLLFQEFFAARFRWRRQTEGQRQKEWLQTAVFDNRYENVMEFYSQLGK